MIYGCIFKMWRNFTYEVLGLRRKLKAIKKNAILLFDSILVLCIIKTCFRFEQKQNEILSLVFGTSTNLSLKKLYYHRKNKNTL
jgi:hypothetical protein